LVEVAAGLFQRGTAGEMLTGRFRDRVVCVLDYSYTTTSANGQGQTTSTTNDCHASGPCRTCWPGWRR
jgi:hypothetical protein